MSNVETISSPTPTLEGLVAGAISRFKTNVIGPDGTMAYRLIDGVYEAMLDSGARSVDILGIVAGESTIGARKLREALARTHGNTTEIDELLMASNIVLAEIAKRHPTIKGDESERIFMMTPRI